MRITPINSPSLAKSKWANQKEFFEAMARHETGNYTSDLFKRANNMFGMKVPTKRPFERTGTSGVYSAYCCSEQSMRDLILWMEFTKFPTTIIDPLTFVSALKSRSYFGDNLVNYYNGVDFHLKQIRNGK